MRYRKANGESKKGRRQRKARGSGRKGKKGMGRNSGMRGAIRRMLAERREPK